MKSIKKIIYILIIAGLFLIVLWYFIFWGHYTELYKDCNKIYIGMNINNMEKILNKYNNEKYDYTYYEDPTYGYSFSVSSNFSNYGCSFKIDQNKGVVEDIIRMWFD